MELEDLKKHWQQQTENELKHTKKDMEELQLILKEKTSKTLAGVSKNYEKIISLLFIGILANVALHPFLHWILGDEGPIFRITFSGVVSLVGFLILFLTVLFFYWIKYTRFRSLVVEEDLKQTLLNRISQLNRLFKQEAIFLCIFFIILFIVGRSTSQFLGNGDFWDILRKDILLSLAAGIAILGFYIFKRYKHYTKYTHELHEYLKELN